VKEEKFMNNINNISITTMKETKCTNTIQSCPIEQENVIQSPITAIGSIANYTIYGKLGRLLQIYFDMERAGILKSYCRKYGLDYNKLKIIADFPEPFFRFDDSELKRAKKESDTLTML